MEEIELSQQKAEKTKHSIQEFWQNRVVITSEEKAQLKDDLLNFLHRVLTDVNSTTQDALNVVPLVELAAKYF